jgi:hypothetical protein
MRRRQKLALLRARPQGLPGGSFRPVLSRAAPVRGPGARSRRRPLWRAGTGTLTQSPSITIIHHDLRRRRRPGRLQIGMAAGFTSETPAGFVGMHTPGRLAGELAAPPTAPRRPRPRPPTSPSGGPFCKPIRGPDSVPIDTRSRKSTEYGRAILRADHRGRCWEPDAQAAPSARTGRDRGAAGACRSRCRRPRTAPRRSVRGPGPANC